MAAYSTELSTFVWNGNVIDAIGSMTLSSSAAPLDITQVGSANAYSIAGIMQTSVSMDIFYTAAQHSALTTDYLAGTARSFAVRATATDQVTGTGRIVGLDVVASTSDIVRASLTIQVTGPISVNATAAHSGVNEV
jgi:predicted secreted protein